LARTSPSAAASDWGRVLGVEAPVQVAAAPALDTMRYRLVGVIAPSTPDSGFRGLAVIAVDEKPARAFRTDAEIAPDRFLKEVSLRGAAIGPRVGPASIRLELALLPPPATGTRPGPVSLAAPSATPSIMSGVPPGVPPPLAAQPLAPPPAAPSGDVPARRPRSPGGGGRLELSAPDVPLNDPADVAPADASGGQSPGPQVPPAAPRSDR
jgi:general secretion pathway protein C